MILVMSATTVPLRKRHLRQLKSRHFEVVVFDPIVFPWVNHALHRDHRKIVVIDDKVVYTGGMNVADYYIHGRPEFGKWRDMHMRLKVIVCLSTDVYSVRCGSVVPATR